MNDEGKLVVVFVLFIFYVFFIVFYGLDMLINSNLSMNILGLIIFGGFVVLLTFFYCNTYLCEKLRRIRKVKED